MAIPLDYKSVLILIPLSYSVMWRVLSTWKISAASLVLKAINITISIWTSPDNQKLNNVSLKVKMCCKMHKTPLTLFLLGGALLGPNDLKQSGISTVLWLESPKFMTLFISVSVWSQWSYFWKKSYEILKNWKKKFYRFDTKGSPLWKKNPKI